MSSSLRRRCYRRLLISINRWTRSHPPLHRRSWASLEPPDLVPHLLGSTVRGFLTWLSAMSVSTALGGGVSTWFCATDRLDAVVGVSRWLCAKVVPRLVAGTNNTCVADTFTTSWEAATGGAEAIAFPALEAITEGLRIEDAEVSSFAALLASKCRRETTNPPAITTVAAIAAMKLRRYLAADSGVYEVVRFCGELWSSARKATRQTALHSTGFGPTSRDSSRQCIKS